MRQVTSDLLHATRMKVYIGADHGGYDFKEKIKPWLSGLGDNVVDCGNYHLDPIDDFPDFAFEVGDRVAKDSGSLGIVLCRSSGGVIIAANKVKGVRAITAVDEVDVKHNREHNDANVLGIAGDYMSLDKAKKLIDVFLRTKYLGEERFLRRLGKIAKREDCL